VVKDHADYEYLPAMALRGRTRAVQVYRVKGVASRQTPVARSSTTDRQSRTQD
jgi:hypothetical protein